MKQNKYIILDRDGVINQDSSAYIKTPDEWVPIDRSLEAISLLTKNSYKVILISNQQVQDRVINKTLSQLNLFGDKINFFSIQHMIRMFLKSGPNDLEIKSQSILFMNK